MKINLQNGTQIERSITSALVGYGVKSYELGFEDFNALLTLNDADLRAMIEYLFMKAIPNAN